MHAALVGAHVAQKKSDTIRNIKAFERWIKKRERLIAKLEGRTLIISTVWDNWQKKSKRL